MRGSKKTDRKKVSKDRIIFKSIFFKFILTLFAFLLVIAFAFSLWLINLVEGAQIDRAKMVLAKDVQVHASHFLEPRSFLFGSDQASPERFIPFFDAIREPGIFRIKVWSLGSRIIFSDDASIIGKDFPEDAELGEAIEGSLNVEMQSEIKPENAGEVTGVEFMEEYIPIYFDGDTKPAGVVEIYSDLRDLRTLLAKIRVLLYSAVATAAVSILLAGGLSFEFLIRRRLASLATTADAVALGDLEARTDAGGEDEIGALARSLDEMTEKLKISYETLEHKVATRTHALELRAQELERLNKFMVGRELKMIELKKKIAELEENKT